jgi:hypothetical protein
MDLELPQVAAGDLGTWIAESIWGTETWVLAELLDIAMFHCPCH